jgi:hypothetical protein
MSQINISLISLKGSMAHPNQPRKDCFATQVLPFTLGASFKSLWLNLWDEQKQKLVSFWSIRMLPRLKCKNMADDIHFKAG